MDPPEGAETIRWYKFIIENDKNTITNLRSGSKDDVRNFATESVKRLNKKYFTHVHFKVHKPYARWTAATIFINLRAVMKMSQNKYKITLNI